MTRATHFTRAEAKALADSILGWGTIAKPETIAKLRKSKSAGQFQSEHILQIAVAEYLDRALPPDAWWSSIDSAGRGAIQGALMKRRGVKRGLLDTLIIWHELTIWIELKSGKGRVTPEQAAFMRMAQDAGHFATLCRSVAAVEEALRFYGIPLRARLT